MPTFQTPRGTQDILPDEWPYWDYVLSHAHEIATLYGYRQIETPTFGDTGLFARTSGEGTDIVEKEMYSFRDRGGDELTLRPEGTAPVVRAYLQHGMHRLPQPVKLYYVERMYRYERPQRGRWREHHQFGCEALGLEDAYVDVEMIALLVDYYNRLGIHDFSLHINSIGDRHCRPAYVRDLVAYLTEHIDGLGEQDRDRLSRNPLRVLDSKEAVSQKVIRGAPSILEYLCQECRAHWDKLRHGLGVLDIAYEVNHRLVRGLDYYNRTVFEFVPRRDGAQAVLNAGGRYDPLAEDLGGPPTPGIGFGLGIERVILELKDEGVEIPPLPTPAVFVAHLGAQAEDEALRQVTTLRRRNIPAVMAYGQPSLKTQLRHADAAATRFAVIIGEDELRDRQVTLRPMAGGEQRTVPAEELVRTIEESAGS